MYRENDMIFSIHPYVRELLAQPLAYKYQSEHNVYKMRTRVLRIIDF